MDGASKFVRGDAIAAVIIVFVNIIGGFVIGIAQQGMSIVEALQRFTLLTIGEGIVTQIPALLISTATGIIVTRAASEGSFGHDLSRQLVQEPRALLIAGGLLVVFGFFGLAAAVHVPDGRGSCLRSSCAGATRRRSPRKRGARGIAGAPGAAGDRRPGRSPRSSRPSRSCRCSRTIRWSWRSASA